MTDLFYGDIEARKYRVKAAITAYVDACEIAKADYDRSVTDAWEAYNQACVKAQEACEQAISGE